MVDSRQELLTGNLSEVAVDIIGLGMHGSWVAITMARMGISKMRLWDDDEVGEENLETQAYRPVDVGRKKTDALYRVLKLFGYTGIIELRGKFELVIDQAGGMEAFYPIVLCHADSMLTRQEVAKHAMMSESALFIESRSAANDLFIHSFVPTMEKLSLYLNGYFPENIQQVACGATGSIAVGMQVAGIIGGIISVSKAGEFADMLPNEHSISLGMYHTSRPFKIKY